MTTMRSSALAGLASVVLLVATGLGLATADTAAAPGSPHPAPGSTSPSPSLCAAPPVAVVATSPGTGQSELYVLPLCPAAGSAPPAPVLRLDHEPGGDLRAELIGGTDTVVVTAPAVARRDVSYNGGLYALRQGADPRLLSHGVVHASRPLVTPSGRIFVSRGVAGPLPADPQTTRSDQLSIDEVDLATGQSRSVHTHQGFAAHLAGWYDGEILVYRVGPSGADIVAVDPDAGTLRSVLPTLPPFARDFSVDPSRGVLVYRGRHDTLSQRWVLDELDLATGTTTRLAESDRFALAPHAWPDGAVAFNPAGRGLSLLGSSDPVSSPLGPGVDVVRATSRDGRYVAALHTVSGRFAVPFVVDRRTGQAAPLGVPARTRSAIAGFVEAAEVSP